MKDLAPKGKDNVLWLEVTHSARFDAAAIEDWRARLQAHLAASGARFDARQSATSRSAGSTQASAARIHPHDRRRTPDFEDRR